MTPAVSQLPWTHHLIILSQSKRPEEREFYLRMAVKERWNKRDQGAAKNPSAVLARKIQAKSNRIN